VIELFFSLLVRFCACHWYGVRLSITVPQRARVARGIQHGHNDDRGPRYETVTARPGTGRSQPSLRHTLFSWLFIDIYRTCSSTSLLHLNILGMTDLYILRTDPISTLSPSPRLARWSFIDNETTKATRANPAHDQESETYHPSCHRAGDIVKGNLNICQLSMCSSYHQEQGEQRFNGAKNASSWRWADCKSTYVQGVSNVQMCRRVRDDCFTKSHLANLTLAAAKLRKKIDDEPSVFMYTYRHDPS
jgi:hypothetical protein